MNVAQQDIIHKWWKISFMNDVAQQVVICGWWSHEWCLVEWIIQNRHHWWIAWSFRIDTIHVIHQWYLFWMMSCWATFMIWSFMSDVLLSQDITHEWCLVDFMNEICHHSWVMSCWAHTHACTAIDPTNHSCDSSMMSILNDELNKTSFVRSSSTNDNLLSHVIHEWDLSSFMNDVLLSHIHVIHQWDLFDELNDALNKTSFMNDYVAQQDVGWWGGFG